MSISAKEAEKLMQQKLTEASDRQHFSADSILEVIDIDLNKFPEKTYPSYLIEKIKNFIVLGLTIQEMRPLILAFLIRFLHVHKFENQEIFEHAFVNLLQELEYHRPNFSPVIHKAIGQIFSIMDPRIQHEFICGLKQQLSHEYYGVRQTLLPMVVQVFPTISDPGTQQVLIKYIETSLLHHDPQEREAGVRAVEQILPIIDPDKRKELLIALSDRLLSENWQVYQATVQVISKFFPTIEDANIQEKFIKHLSIMLLVNDIYAYAERLAAVKAIIQIFPAIKDLSIQKMFIKKFINILSDNQQILIRSDIAQAVGQILPAIADINIRQTFVIDFRDRFLSLLNHDQWTVRKTAIEVIAQVFPFADFDTQMRFIEALNSKLCGKDCYIKGEAIQAITQIFFDIKDHEIQKTFITTLLNLSNQETAKSEILQAIAQVFPAIVDPKIREKFINLLKNRLSDNNSVVRKAAVQTLCKVFDAISDPKIQKMFITSLEDRLSDAGFGVKEAAIQCVLKILVTMNNPEIGKMFVTRLKDWLSDRNAVIRKTAVQILVQILPGITDPKNQEIFIKDLKNKLSDYYLEVRLAATDAIVLLDIENFLPDQAIDNEDKPIVFAFTDLMNKKKKMLGNEDNQLQDYEVKAPAIEEPLIKSNTFCNIL